MLDLPANDSPLADHRLDELRAEIATLAVQHPEWTRGIDSFDDYLRDFDGAATLEAESLQAFQAAERVKKEGVALTEQADAARSEVERCAQGVMDCAEELGQASWHGILREELPMRPEFDECVDAQYAERVQQDLGSGMAADLRRRLQDALGRREGNLIESLRRAGRRLLVAAAEDSVRCPSTQAVLTRVAARRADHAAAETRLAESNQKIQRWSQTSGAELGQPQAVSLDDVRRWNGERRQALFERRYERRRSALRMTQHLLENRHQIADATLRQRIEKLEATAKDLQKAPRYELARVDESGARAPALSRVDEYTELGRRGCIGCLGVVTLGAIVVSMKSCKELGPSGPWFSPSGGGRGGGGGGGHCTCNTVCTCNLICQAHRLLDANPLVRQIAEFVLLSAGHRALDYLAWAERGSEGPLRDRIAGLRRAILNRASLPSLPVLGDDDFAALIHHPDRVIRLMVCQMAVVQASRGSIDGSRLAAALPLMEAHSRQFYLLPSVPLPGIALAAVEPGS